MPRHHRAALLLAERYGVPVDVANETLQEALAVGLGVEPTARFLYASLAGQLPLTVCREAVALLPLRPRPVARLAYSG